MTVKVYLSRYNDQHSDAEAHKALDTMPASIRDHISVYRDPLSRWSRIQGKVLLSKVIQDFGLNLTLHDLHYTVHNKPYFAGSLFDFSIAHSGELVICAAATGTKLGIDIEQIQHIDLTDYRDQLTTAEWCHINQSPDKTTAFYHLWTRKEALIKATGRGTDIDMAEIDVLADQVTLDGVAYYLYSLTVDSRPSATSYIAYLAVNNDKADIQIHAI